METNGQDEVESVQYTEAMKKFDRMKGAMVTGDRDAALEVYAEAHIDDEAFRVLSGVTMFLSLLFRYPDEDVHTAVSEHLELFEEFIEEYVGGALEVPSREALEPVYVKLFVTDINGVPAVPYSSAYTDRERLLMRESTVELKKLMAEHGFALTEGVKEIEDHIYIMMEFLSNIFERIADTDDDGERIDALRAVMIVFEKYLAPMIDPFGDAVVKNDDTGYYAAAANMAKGFVHDFPDFMTEILFEETEEENEDA